MAYEIYSELTLASNAGSDPIIYRKEVTENVPAATTLGDSHVFTYAHGLPVTPYCFGTYSDDGFTTSYDFGHGPYGTVTLGGFDGYTISARVWSDPTNVYIEVLSFNSAKNITFRVVGIAPFFLEQNTVINTPPVQDNIVFDSTVNRLKRYTAFQYSTTTVNDGQVYSASLPIPMGYKPFAMVFVQSGNKISLGNTANTISGSGYTVQYQTSATTFFVTWRANIVTPLTFHGVIYLDA